MELMNYKRKHHIDAMKGFAILLVVVGHVFQRNMPNPSDITGIKVINSFLMPMFMFLSGYIIFGRTNGSIITLVEKRFKTLIIPFFSWYILYYLFSKLYFTGLKPFFSYPSSFISYIYIGILHPENGLWYLWALFLNYSVLILILPLNKYFGDLSLVIATLVLNLIPIDIAGLADLKYYFAFFATGYVVAKYKTCLKKWEGLFQTVAIISFPILVPYWNYTKPTLISIFSFSNLLSSHNFFYNYIVAISGIILTDFMLMKINKSKLYSLFVWLGPKTIDIYGGHNLFLRLGVGEGIIKALSAFIPALFLPLVLGFIIKQSKILNMFLLGQWDLKALKIRGEVVQTEVSRSI